MSSWSRLWTKRYENTKNQLLGSVHIKVVVIGPPKVPVLKDVLYTH